MGLTAHAKEQPGLASLVADGARSDHLRARLCLPDTALAFVSAATVDGIEHPDDFVTLLQLLWCRQDGDSPGIKRLNGRIAIPFVLETPGHVRTMRNIARLKRLLRDYTHTLFYAPYRLSVDIDQEAREVTLHTSREGGGDTPSFQLLRNRWTLTGFSGGDAC